MTMQDITIKYPFSECMIRHLHKSIPEPKHLTFGSHPMSLIAKIEVNLKSITSHRAQTWVVEFCLSMKTQIITQLTLFITEPSALPADCTRTLTAFWKIQHQAKCNFCLKCNICDLSWFTMLCGFEVKVSTSESCVFCWRWRVTAVLALVWSSFHHWGPEKSHHFAERPLYALSDGGTSRPADVVEQIALTVARGLTSVWK